MEQVPSQENQPQGLEAALNGLRSFAESYTATAISEPTGAKVQNLIRKIGAYGDRQFESALEAARRATGPGPFAGRTVDCKLGCAYCCHQAVNATIPEVLALADWLRENKSEEELKLIRDAASAYRKQHSGNTPKEYADSRVACPMLQNSVCSAYEARPLVCRSYHSYNVESCRRRFAGEPDVMKNGQDMQPAALLILDALRRGIFEAARNAHRPGELVMLGVAISIALETPDATRRWNSGEDLFAEAAFVPQAS